MRIHILLSCMCLMLHFKNVFTIKNASLKKLHSSRVDEDDLKPFDLDEIIDPDFHFNIKDFNGKWISTDSFFHKKDNKYWIYNVRTTETTEIPLDDALKNIKNLSEVALSPARVNALLEYDTTVLENVYKSCVVYNFETKASTLLGEKLLHCSWIGSQDNNDILVYIHKNDIYTWQTGIKTRITYSGVPNIISNGFSTYPTIYPSPNADKLVYATHSRKDVPHHEYDIYGEPGDLRNQYQVKVDMRYPKPGNVPVKTTLTLVYLKNGFNNITMPQPNEFHGENCVFINAEWISNNFIVGVWLNRLQNMMIFQKCNADTGACEDIKKLTRPDGWFDTNPVNTAMRCESKVEKCFYFDDTYNLPRIYSFGLNGDILGVKSTEWISANKILGYHAESDELIYEAISYITPEQQSIYKSSTCLSCPIETPEENPCSYATASCSTDCSYLAITCFGPDPSFTNIYDTATKELVNEWEHNIKAREKLEEYRIMDVRYLRIPVGDGFDAKIRLSFPWEINPEETTEKYPMIVHVSGDPDSCVVFDSYTIGFREYLVTNRKFVYAEIDGRGSNFKGNDMHYTISGRLGTIEIADFISVTKALQLTYPFIDAENTGIWGLGYGGYSTAMVLARDVKHIFKAGISVAPITSWYNYNQVYTERFMKMPTNDSNLQAYIDSDVTRIVEGIRGHKFLLIHGNADDNVPYQHSMLLSRALQKAEISFEQMSYPDEGHDFTGVFSHFLKTMDYFWQRHFGLTQ